MGNKHPDGPAIKVRDNNIDQALRKLKKDLQKDGLFREMKLREHFEKPSEKKSREKQEALRRWRKNRIKTIQREHGVDKKSAQAIIKGRSPR